MRTTPEADEQEPTEETSLDQQHLKKQQANQAQPKERPSGQLRVQYLHGPHAPGEGLHEDEAGDAGNRDDRHLSLQLKDGK